MTFTCSQPQLVSTTFLSSSNSFLSLPLNATTETLSVTFQFRTWNREGMLLSAWLRRESERLLLLLVHGQLRLTHHRSALQSSDIVIGEMSTSVHVCFYEVWKLWGLNLQHSVCQPKSWSPHPKKNTTLCCNPNNNNNTYYLSIYNIICIVIIIIIIIIIITIIIILSQLRQLLKIYRLFCCCKPLLIQTL